MHEIVQAAPERVPAISGTLARAFHDDPLFALLGDTSTRGQAGQRFFELLDVPLAEAGLLWEIGDAAAAAAWIPPDGHDTWAASDDATRDLVRELTADGGACWEATWDWVLERLPDEPVWFLDHIGVDPVAQGSGLGRALIDHGLARATADGLPAFLETFEPANVPYYEYLGFHVVEHGDPPLGGPHAWFMRRDP